MDTKPTYTKFHDFANGSIAYMVNHADFTEAKMYVETRRSGNIWIAYETYDEQTAVTGFNREQAAQKMLKQAQYVLCGLRAQNFWYSEEERLTSGSTAWHALYSGRENADDTVAEGNVTDDSTEYWQLALSGYNSLMDELEGRERKLAETHNLIDLPVCNWCGLRAAKVTPINDDREFCDECLPIAKLSHEFDALDEEEQESKDAKIAASKYADETVEDFNPKRWFEVALAQYTAMTGEPTSVAEIASTPVGTSDGLELFVGEDEHGDVHVRIVGQNITYGWLRAAAAAKKWTGGLKVQQVSADSSESGLRFVFRYGA